MAARKVSFDGERMVTGCIVRHLILPLCTDDSVRIVRGDDRCSTGVPGLYPCGEGAGYAGGITSAAVDGLRCAECVIQALQNEA